MNNNYVIITDTGCDIAPEILKQWGVCAADLKFRIDGEDKDYTNAEISSADFYARMRDGASAKTSAVNAEQFKDMFRPVLEQGTDLLYLGFSSGLSATYQSSVMAVEDLREEFPDRKIFAVDTLCASSGQGLLVRLALDKKNEGASIEDVARFVEDNRLHLCHWFTVDDLVYLKRGGRVSPAVAFVGGMLGIKPVLHVDDEGHLINRGKVRGRKASLESLVNHYVELATGEGPIYICHADCMDDVELLKGMLREKAGVEVDRVCDIGAVIGSHSGPGTIALFFLGKNR